MNILSNKEKSSSPVFYKSLSKFVYTHEEFTRLFNLRMKILKDLKEKNTCIDNLTDLEDIYSHFITRLILANNLKTSKWFVSAEALLLKFRLNKRYIDFNFTMKISSCSHPLKIDPLFYTKIDRDINLSDKNIFEMSKESRFNEEVNVKKIKFSDFLCVHFSRISQMLANRSIVPVEGYVYLDKKSRDILISNQYKLDLEIEMKKLSFLLKKHPDERFEKLRNSCFTENPEKFANSSSLNDSQYFPPCIKKILHLFKTNKHIGNNDRQTLLMFFKNANIPINETIDLFRTNFNLSQDLFDKKYLYHIRHSYGLEGKKANYTSYSCGKMATLRNSENKSSCPFLDDKTYIRNLYNFDIEDIFTKKSAISKCQKVLNKSLNLEGKNFTTPLQHFTICKENKKTDQ